MKKKIIGAVISILTIVTASFSVQAATVSITKAEVKDANTVSVSVSVADAAANSQYTMLVTKADSSGNYTLNNAVYINQLKSGEYTANGSTVTFDMDIAIAEGGTYQLKVGATEAKEADAKPIPYEGTDVPNPPTPVAGLYGDADVNEVLTANDSAVVLKEVVDPNYEAKAVFEIKDVDGDGEITATDAAFILSKVLNSSNTFPVEK